MNYLMKFKTKKRNRYEGYREVQLNKKLCCYFCASFHVYFARSLRKQASYKSYPLIHGVEVNRDTGMLREVKEWTLFLNFVDARKLSKIQPGNSNQVIRKFSIWRSTLYIRDMTAETERWTEIRTKEMLRDRDRWIGECVRTTERERERKR